MFFSVVIPLYNKKDVIVRTLTSVLDQTFSDYEVIIVDDGSTDGSVSQVERFLFEVKDHRGVQPVRVITQSNAGVSAARNVGARNAVGRFVACLDGDDVWLPNHLADLHAVVEKYPSAKVLSTNEGVITGGKVLLPLTNRSEVTSVNVFDYPEGDYPLHSSAIAIDREFLLKLGGYDERFSFYEDRELYYRMAEVVGDFYVNWRVSANYTNDAAVRITQIERPYSEWAYLVLAEKRISDGTASSALRKCVTRTAYLILRGQMLRLRWRNVKQFMQTYPSIVRSIRVFRMFGCGCTGRLVASVVMGAECLVERIGAMCRRLR